MPEKMLQFTKVARGMPAKRTADERAADFSEIYDAYLPDTAKAQASRCSQCGVPFCQQGCPLQNNIPDWLMLAAEDRLKRHISSPLRQIPCRKSAAASALRTVFAKAFAPLSNPDMAR